MWVKVVKFCIFFGVIQCVFYCEESIFVMLVYLVLSGSNFCEFYLVECSDIFLVVVKCL